MVIAAYAIRFLSSASRERFLEIVQGTEVREVLDDLECEVNDGDAWGAAHVLAHDAGFL